MMLQRKFGKGVPLTHGSFSQKNTAEKFVDFLKSVVPVNVKKAQELISQDVHTSKKSYKFTSSVEMVSIISRSRTGMTLHLYHGLIANLLIVCVKNPIPHLRVLDSLH